uniref:Uncharacterized protein n=1 Tax=Nomascus leucogenys TaxID=61853 RepID=A0A2I3H9Y3_NOMLE
MEDKTQKDSWKPRLPEKARACPSPYCKAMARPRQNPGSLKSSAELVPHMLFPVNLTSSVLVEHKFHTRLYAMPASAQGAPSGSG